MAKKTYQQYLNEVRYSHPEWTSEQQAAEAKKIYQSDPNSTYTGKSNLPPNPTPSPNPSSTDGTVKNKPTFNPNINDSGSEDSGVVGIELGFGTGASLPPVKMASYVVTLSSTNKTAFNNLKNLVKIASGKNIQDPTTLGNWIERYSAAMRTSTDPLVKTLSVEDMLRNSAAAKSAAAEAKLPSRQVYQYTPEQREKVISKGAESLIGRSFTEEEKKQDWYKELSGAIEKMMNAGTLSTTTKKKNPVTGKLENVTVQTPGYSEEKALAKVGQVVGTQLADDVKRKTDSDFGAWLFEQIGGK